MRGPRRTRRAAPPLRHGVTPLPRRGADKDPMLAPCPDLDAIARPFPGRVGYAVVHLEDGARLSRRGGEAFRAQSVYKIPIAMAALDVARKRGWKPDHRVKVLPADVVWGPFPSPARDAWRRGEPDVPLADLVHHALAVSDNTASDVLLRVAGGPKAVNAYTAGLGLAGIVVATPLARFAPDRNTITPDAAAALLGTLWRDPRVPAATRTTILAAMARCKTGPGRLKGLLPPGTAIAHKTGTSGTWGGVTAATNDVGIVTLPDGKHLAIAAFVADARAAEPACEGVIARLARAAWGCWARRR